MYKQLDKIDRKLDVLDERLDEIVVVQAEMRMDLREHMRRTAALETLVENTRGDVHTLKVTEAARDMVRTKVKWGVGIVGALVSLVAALYKIFMA